MLPSLPSLGAWIETRTSIRTINRVQFQSWGCASGMCIPHTHGDESVEVANFPNPRGVEDQNRKRQDAGYLAAQGISEIRHEGNIREEE